eukprot:1501390-Pyramimonas_sp.AAC.1
MEAKLDRAYFNNHRLKIEKLLMTRKYINKVLELKRCGSGDPGPESNHQTQSQVRWYRRCYMKRISANSSSANSWLKSSSHWSVVWSCWWILRTSNYGCAALESLLPQPTPYFSRATTCLPHSDVPVSPLQELLKDGFPTHPNAIQELWLYLRAKLCKQATFETKSLARTKASGKAASTFN